jgi:hypothetical protein
VRARRDARAHRVVEANEADGVALAKQQERERRGELLGVGTLGEPAVGGGTAPVHGSADVEHDGGAEVGLLLVLLDDPAIGARGDLPVDVAKVVARLIGTKIGELHREPLARRPVQSAEESVDDPASDDLEVTELRERGGVEEICPGRKLHARWKVFAGMRPA